MMIDITWPAVMYLVYVCLIFSHMLREIWWRRPWPFKRFKITAAADSWTLNLGASKGGFSLLNNLFWDPITYVSSDSEQLCITIAWVTLFYERHFIGNRVGWGEGCVIRTIHIIITESYLVNCVVYDARK